MVYLFALAAAAVSATAGVLQRVGLETVPDSSAMRLSLLSQAVRRGIWLAGFGLLLLQFVLGAMALRFGPLGVVQPVLTTDLLFVVAILAVFLHRPIGSREVIGACGVVAGLASFLVLAAPTVGKGLPDNRAWWWVTAVTVSGAVVMVVATRWGPRWWRAAAFGTAAAALFAYNAALTKATTSLITEGWGHVFTHWEPYGIAVTGAVGFFFLQNALHAGPLTASRTAMVIVSPMASIVIGATVFAEHIRSTPAALAGEAAALAILFSGAFVLVRSPLVSGAGAEHPTEPRTVAEPVLAPAIEPIAD